MTERYRFAVCRHTDWSEAEYVGENDLSIFARLERQSTKILRKVVEDVFLYEAGDELINALGTALCI